MRGDPEGAGAHTSRSVPDEGNPIRGGTRKASGRGGVLKQTTWTGPLVTESRLVRLAAHGGWSAAAWVLSTRATSADFEEASIWLDNRFRFY